MVPGKVMCHVSTRALHPLRDQRAKLVMSLDSNVGHFTTNPHPTQSPKMSYGKKDEDADIGLVKVDRTQVFQEGMIRKLWHASRLAVAS